MAYTKNTWTDGVNGGTPITAAKLNNIETGIAAARVDSDMPKAHLHTSTTQTGLAANWQTIHLDTATIDTHGGLNKGGYTYVVPAGQGGLYLLSGSVYVGALATTYLSNIWVNNAEVAGYTSGNSTYMASASYAMGLATGARIVNLNAGDAVELVGYSVAAGWTAQPNTPTASWLSVMRIA